MKIIKLANSLLLASLISTKSFATDTKVVDKSIKIKVSEPLSKMQKRELREMGVKNIVYVGDMNYYLYGDATKIDRYVATHKNISLLKSDLEDERVDSSIYKSDATLGELEVVTYLKLTLLFLDEMSDSEIESYLNSSGIEADLLSNNMELKSANIRIESGDLEKLRKLDKILYIQKAVSIGAKNARTRSYEGADSISKGAYNLNAKGMRVAVVDGGLVRATHQEFMSGGKSRVHDIGDYDYADHATHVAGTIAAQGVDAKAKGMATGSEIYSFSFYDGAFADKAIDIYNHYDILFSNHSYGYNEKKKLATYDVEAAKQDRAVYQNPFLNIFQAAGNDGIDESYPAYGKIKGPANSKNILTIGALNINANARARFSSNGPVKDGRIKPDLCVRGEGIYSTAAQSDSDYIWMNGTSMATPAATGMGVLVSEAYKRVSGGYDIRHDILKAALINAAKDRGRRGPDYDTGFGMIDVKGAVDEINSINSTSPLIHIDTISYKESRSYNFSITHSRKFKATICWVDPSASPSSSSSLVNDLDMVLVSSSGKRYYPYTLNPANPTEFAHKDRENHVDNIEQIEVDNLPAGDYRLVVKGGVVVTSKQDFAIASNVSISKKSNIIELQPSQLQNFAKVIQASIR